MKDNSQDDKRHTHDSTATIGAVVVLAIVVLCLFTPLLVNLAFQHVAPVGFLEARWTPGELWDMQEVFSRVSEPSFLDA